MSRRTVAARRINYLTTRRPAPTIRRRSPTLRFWTTPFCGPAVTQRDENHRTVFDGMLQWIGAGDGLNMNYRWSQTKRTNRNRQELLYLEGLYPFANVRTSDPISGKRLALKKV